MSNDSILNDVAGYYGDKIDRHGPSPAGVDWRDTTSQNLRFDQLLRVLGSADAGVVDLGCGYGALLEHMRARDKTGPYHGVDIAPAMIAAARQRHADDPKAVFEISARSSVVLDYAVASGIFNVRLDHTDDVWIRYIEDTIGILDAAGRRGFAFNCLTSYSDPDRKRPDLYYGDPGYFFDLCKRRYSRNVALLHDYDLYEFTLLVRK
jgi:SAM-dependent methyltransferase